MRDRVDRECAAANATRPHLLPAQGGERLIRLSEPWLGITRPNLYEFKYQEEPAAGMWFVRGQSIVTELFGEPFLIARGDSGPHAIWLAMRFFTGCIDLIDQAFTAKTVVRRNITVYGLFGAHGKVCDYYKEIDLACRARGMRSSCELRLPLEGRFGYAGNGSVTDPNLGIFTIR